MVLFKSKNKISVVIFAVIAMLAVGLFGCTYGFPKGFDKDECIKKAEEIINIVNTKDYDAVHAFLRDDLEEKVTAEDFKQSWESKLNKIGEFKKFGKPVLSGEMEKDTGKEFAMVVYYCYYEAGEAIYTVYFDSDMEMTSISMQLD